MKPDFTKLENTGKVIDCGSDSLSLLFVYEEWSAFLSLGVGQKGYYGHWLSSEYRGNLTKEEAAMLLMKLR